MDENYGCVVCIFRHRTAVTVGEFAKRRFKLEGVEVNSRRHRKRLYGRIRSKNMFLGEGDGDVQTS
jgi:hypothetical protein